jgi:hypothetical protein
MYDPADTTTTVSGFSKEETRNCGQDENVLCATPEPSLGHDDFERVSARDGEQVVQLAVVSLMLASTFFKYSRYPRNAWRPTLVRLQIVSGTFPRKVFSIFT